MHFTKGEKSPSQDLFEKSARKNRLIFLKKKEEAYNEIVDSLVEECVSGWDSNLLIPIIEDNQFVLTISLKHFIQIYIKKRAMRITEA